MTEILINRFEELYNWWFNPVNSNCWFNATEQDDIKISNLFGDLLTHKYFDVDLLNYKQSIGFILVHDQIIRHWVRTNNYTNKKNEYFLLHYKIIENFIKNFYFKNKNIINSYDFCFILLPLRHTQDFNLIKFVLVETWNKLEKLDKTKQNNQLKQIYTKYLKATYERANPNIIFETNNNDTKNFVNMHEKIEQSVFKYSTVLDEKCLSYTFNQNYLSNDLNKYTLVNDSKQISKSSNLIVSISGGVDSMVLAFVLSALGYSVILVHINYSNRSNTHLEQEFVLEWGNYLGLRTFYRVLDEINRPKCMEYDLRNLYESYTRDQRYQTYVEAAKIMGWDNYSIVLGHNHDDCIENIFTNIATKSKWDNLYGMNFSSEIKFKEYKLTFLRPFIKIPKFEIYQFAFDYNILFLWDSTPKWSQRGKIRDLVRPSLEEFNPEIITGLDELKNVLEESVGCVDYIVKMWIKQTPIKEGIKFLKIIEISELIKTKIFWNRLLGELGIHISLKCLESLIIKLNQIEENFDYIQINREEKFQLNKGLQIKFIKNKTNQLLIIV